MFDHIGFPVSNLPRQQAVLQNRARAARRRLVMELTAEQTGSPSHAGFGENGKPYFWIGDGEGVVRGRSTSRSRRRPRADVDAFYKAAFAAGGRDNGTPGLRPHYHAHYYGAFVLDPDGHNIEAVCHSAEA